MRLPVMTVRRWMLAVAAVALILAVVAGLRNRAYYLKKYRSFGLLERVSGIRRDEKDENGMSWLAEWYFEPDGRLKRKYLRRFDAMHAYYVGLRRKYLYAANHPWVYVEPDAPEPQVEVEEDGPGPQ
jgi:hypothetical protein